MKICSQCKKNLPLNNFTNNTKCCDACKNKRKEYYKENREKEINYSTQYNINNKDNYLQYMQQYNKKYYIENSLEIINKAKEYRIENMEHCTTYKKEYNKKRSKNDPLFKLSCKLRNMLNSFITCKNDDKINIIIGCSKSDFKKHIENQFENWMSWDNHGRYNGEINYGWDFDHIMPLSSANCEEDLIKLNHFSNIRPLCSKVNRYINKNNK